MVSEETRHGVSERPPTLGVVAHRFLRGVGLNSDLDPLARAVEGAVAEVVHPPALRDVLRGTWLGHALHPLLTDFTAGPWMAATFLDLFGPKGSSPAARRLVAFGLVAAVPTLLSGFVDWEETDGAERRVGLVHAGTASLATLLYGCSFLARRKGNERSGIVLGLLGGAVAFWDGYIGGDLALVGRIGAGRRLRRPGRPDIPSAATPRSSDHNPQLF